MKTLSEAKSRLTAHLSPRQRETLALDMLHHVVHTLCDSEIFEQVYVVSADSRVLESSQHWGAEPLQEARSGHNPALQSAAWTIMERSTWRSGAFSTWAILREQHSLQAEVEMNAADLLLDESLLTISADLPLLTRTDLVELATLAENYQVVLADSSDGTGTNAFLARPPLVLPYLFGVNSLPAYVRAARQKNLSYTLYHSHHLAFDIDTFEDLHELEQSSRSWSTLASLTR